MPPGTFQPVMRPGDGANVSGFSALMRHSMAWPSELDRQRDHVLKSLSRGDADLRAHQIDARHHLGDGMLHLDAGIDFNEVEIALFIHQEFDRSRVAVADGFQGFAELGRSRVRESPGASAGDGDSSRSF